MALSGRINGSVTQNSSAYEFYITWSATQSTAGNYSDVTAQVWWERKPGFYNEFDTVGERSASVTIGDTTEAWTQRFNLIPFSPNPYKIKEKTVRVNHNSDGTKTLLIAARANGHAASFGPSVNALSGGDCTATASVTLDAIPRASTTSLNKGAVGVGDKIKVTITPAITGATHSIKWTLKNNTISATLPAGTNTHELTVPSAWNSQLPTAMSGTASCVVQTTYNGANIGAPITKTFAFNIAAYNPTCTLTITGKALLGGQYVQGKSAAACSVAATSANGGSIVSITTAAEGKTYSGASFDTAAFAAAGSMSITTTATDSRGKTATDTKTVSVRAYAAPYIMEISAVRCLSNGTPDDNGTYGRVTFRGGVSDVNGQNARTYKINGVTQTNPEATINKSDIIISGITTDAVHTVTATITDNYTTTTRTTTIPTVAVTMDYHASGGGVAFGKVATEADVLDSAWPIRAGSLPSAPTGNLLAKGTDGTISDSGKKAGDFEASGAISAHNTDASAHSTAMGAKADKVSGTTTDFLAKLDAGGNLANSDYKAPLQHTIYNSTTGWTKILSWGYVQDCSIRIRGYAGRGYYEGRGSWELLFCVSDATTHRADLIMATNGIDTSKFDLRIVGTTYSLFFYAAGWSYWRVVAERFRVYPEIYQHNDLLTPTGTAIPVYWGKNGDLPLTGGTLTGQLEAPTMRATSDTDASLSSTGHAFQVGSTDKANIAMDGNEIMARNNGAASILFLNADGGDVRVNGKSVYKAEDTIPIADGGTGSTTAANARTALGIRTFSGNCIILVSGRNYGEVTITGVTASSVITGVVASSQAATGWSINSIIAGSAKATIYFNQNSTTANQNISVKLIAIG